MSAVGKQGDVTFSSGHICAYLLIEGDKKATGKLFFCYLLAAPVSPFSSMTAQYVLSSPSSPLPSTYINQCYKQKPVQPAPSRGWTKTLLVCIRAECKDSSALFKETRGADKATVNFKGGIKEIYINKKTVQHESEHDLSSCGFYFSYSDGL